MAKSADAFRTISEVADWLETPAHVLRFWESKFSQVKPVKRAGGRRYYRPSDMLLIGGIKKLLHHDGMTIKGVQKLLRDQGVKHVAGHSQPLDDITAAEVDDAATTGTILDFQKETGSAQARDTAEAPPAQAAAPLSEAPDTTAAPQDSDASDMPPVMPSFSHRREAAAEPPSSSEPPKEPAAKTETDDARPEVADAPPTLIKIDVPDDPADDIAAETGPLSQLAGLRAPLSADLADRLAPIMDRLRQTGQN